VLHPDILLRIDAGAQHAGASMLIRGPAAVARQAVRGIRQMLSGPAAGLRPVLVNGSAGVVVTMDGQPFAVMGFTIADGKITGIDAIADPGRVRTITAAVATAE
jgi:RNA polymerase sigma-70 factor, ECF subfamily